MHFVVKKQRFLYSYTITSKPSSLDLFWNFISIPKFGTKAKSSPTKNKGKKSLSQGGKSDSCKSCLIFLVGLFESGLKNSPPCRFLIFNF